MADVSLIEPLIGSLREHYENVDEDLVRRAFAVANEAHAGRVGFDGQPA